MSSRSLTPFYTFTAVYLLSPNPNIGWINDDLLSLCCLVDTGHDDVLFVDVADVIDTSTYRKCRRGGVDTGQVMKGDMTGDVSSLGCKETATIHGSNT